MKGPQGPFFIRPGFRKSFEKLRRRQKEEEKNIRYNKDKGQKDPEFACSH